MRILVFSDSHKEVSACEKVIKTIAMVDMIIHAGDHLEDAVWIEKLFPDIPVVSVSGNCDFSGGVYEQVVEAAGKRIFLTHGHNYKVKSELQYTSLRDRATELGCDCAVFGHTHIPVNDPSGNVVLLNPGSIKYTRTYGVIEIENDKLRTAVCDASYII